MTKCWISLAVGIAAFCLFGSVAAEDAGQTAPPPHAGKYYSTGNMRYFTMLKPDGQFFVHQGEGDLNGHYSVHEDSLRLTLDDGRISLIGHIRADTIIDNDGERWIRPQVSFTNRTIRQESILDLQDRLPKGWLLRHWEGRYYISKLPKGPPPSSLDAEAAVIIIRHGESDALATAWNMVADTPDYSMHLSLAPSGDLWPTAKDDLVALFLVEMSSQTGGAANGSQPTHSETNQTPSATDSRR
jgi:hypothetical protein